MCDGPAFPLVENINKGIMGDSLVGSTELAAEMTENVMNYGHQVDKSWM